MHLIDSFLIEPSRWPLVISFVITIHIMEVILWHPDGSAVPSLILAFASPHDKCL